MKSMTLHRAARERGFSLLEMMIALVILGVITSQMFVVLSSQKRAAIGGSRSNDIQESARLITDLLAFDARNAGVMVPREAAISSRDGGTAGPDRICMSDSSYFQIPAPGVRSAFWDSVGGRITAPHATVTGTNRIVIERLNVDMDGFANDWNPQGLVTQPRIGIIIARADGRASYCGQINTLDAATRNVTLSASDSFPVTFTSGGPELIAVPAIVYELIDEGRGADDISTLYRNGIAVSTQVEDLQIEYGIDSTGAGLTPDGQLGNTEFPIHDVSTALRPSIPPIVTTGSSLQINGSTTIVVTPLSRVRRVRLSVLARTEREDEAGNRLVRNLRPALANRIASTRRDAFARRAYTVSVMPRNMLTLGEVTNVP
jgi:prepilin-type N-terminal cleavage/methylation domain-containing protein